MTAASPAVTSIAAEQTVRQLMLTTAQHVRQEALLAAAPRRHGRLRSLPTSSASHQARTQSTFMRLVSIIEAHIAGQLVERIEKHVPTPRTPVLDDIYVSAEDKAIGSWSTMSESYKRWLGIRFNASSDWTSILTMTDIRNAIAHGLGELTRRQARKDLKQLTRAFSSVGVKVHGTSLRVSEDAIRNAAATGGRFVVWLDEQLRAYDLTFPPSE